MIYRDQDFCVSPQNTSTLDVLILVMAPKGSESAKF